MVRRNAGIILRQINSLLTAGTFSGLSDSQLLDRFLAGHDEVSELAFTVLVERHGPMVLGVCRRILADPHDAEDAFQATFLVLVRKAASVRVDGSIGRWLFGVATRVASRSRADIRRRHGREHVGLDRLKIVAEPGSLTSLDRAELQSILAQEIARLPDRLQAPVILCDLEGSSDMEAARRLGWPVGTVKSRLSRARARLRDRLTRRGLTPSDLAITIPLLPMSLPHSLVEATIRAALSLIAGRLTTAGVVSASVATLTQGVLRTMYWTKLKLAAVAILLILTGSAALVAQATAQKPDGGRGIVDNTSTPAKATEPDTSSGAAIDVEMLERAWASAMPRRDAAIVNRILADDFENVDPLGTVFTKESYLSHLRNGAFFSQPLQHHEIKIRVLGESALATSRIRIPTIPPEGLLTHLYVKRQGRWQCVAAHESWLSGMTWKPLDTAQPGEGVPREQPANSVTPTRSAARRDQAAMNCTACHAMTHSQPIEEAMNRPQPRANDCAVCHAVNLHGMGFQTEATTLHDPYDAIRADRHTIIRPPFDCRVEKVLVKVGQTVKKGDPLFALLSTDLEAAKIDYKIALNESERTQDRLRWAREMHAKGFQSADQMAAAQIAVEHSGLRIHLAGSKLMNYGLTDEEIKQIPHEESQRRARFTLSSLVDGKVAEIRAEPGSRTSYNTNNALMIIEATAPSKPSRR
jgi:RNA polymerase sigma factor (sigma-70 family)